MKSTSELVSLFYQGDIVSALYKRFCGHAARNTASDHDNSLFMLCAGQLLRDLGLTSETRVCRAAKMNDVGGCTFMAAQARSGFFFHSMIGIIEQLIIAHQLPRHRHHVRFAGSDDLLSFRHGRDTADNGNGNMNIRICLDLLGPFHIVAMRKIECRHGIWHILWLNNESLRDMDGIYVFLGKTDKRLCLFDPHTARNQFIAADAHIDAQAVAYTLPHCF